MFAMRSYVAPYTPDSDRLPARLPFLLAARTALRFTVHPLFEIDRLRLRPSLFDLFI